MFEFFKRKPKEDTVSKAYFDEMMALAQDAIDDAQQSARLSDEAVQVAERQIQQERNTIGNMLQRNRELQTQLLAARAEADANHDDAEAHRARLKRDREYHANRRQAREKQAAE